MEGSRERYGGGVIVTQRLQSPHKSAVGCQSTRTPAFLRRIIMKIAVVLALAFSLAPAYAFTAPRPVGRVFATCLSMAVSKTDLKGAQEMIDGILDEKNWLVYFPVCWLLSCWDRNVCVKSSHRHELFLLCGRQHTAAPS